MSQDQSTAKCPACGSSELAQGMMYGNVSWIKQGSYPWFFGGTKIEASVCLKCGILTPHLSQNDLAKLRSEFATPS